HCRLHPSLFYCSSAPPHLHSFPTRRSSDLELLLGLSPAGTGQRPGGPGPESQLHPELLPVPDPSRLCPPEPGCRPAVATDSEPGAHLPQPAGGQSLLDAARRAGPAPVRDHAIIATLLYTGCRVSELTALRVRDVNFTTETIRIFGKGAKERLVPLHPELAVILRNYLRVRQVPPGSPEPERLFRNQRGGPMTRHGVHYLIKRIAKAVPGDLPGLSAHKLRHTMA